MSTVPHRLRDLSAIPLKFNESVSRNERSNQRRREKRLLAEYDGNVRIERYNSTDSLPKLIEDAEYVASRSYQRGIGVGFIPRTRFDSGSNSLPRKAGFVPGCLGLGGTPTAFWIGTLREVRSLAIIWRLIQSCRACPTWHSVLGYERYFEEMQDATPGVSLIDFGRGDAAYKARFGTTVKATANLYLFALTWRGLYSSTIETGSRLTTSLAKAALARFGVLERVKRRQRQRAVGVPDDN